MMIKLNFIRLSQHFWLHEFESPDSKTVMIQPELLHRLEALRVILNTPIVITSGYRTKKHNTKIKGAKKSLHMLGRAVDVKINSFNVDNVKSIAKLCGFKFIKYYPTTQHFHLDIR